MELWGLWCLRWMWGCEVVSLWVSVRFVTSVTLVGVCEDYESMMLWHCEACEICGVCEVLETVRWWKYEAVRLWDCETVSLRVWKYACFLPAPLSLCLCFYITMCVTLSYQRSVSRMTNNWVRRAIYTLGWSMHTSTCCYALNGPARFWLI